MLYLGHVSVSDSHVSDRSALGRPWRSNADAVPSIFILQYKATIVPDTVGTKRKPILHWGPGLVTNPFL